jgi:catechol 2,3-dioxygenase-like lactoylglutathione lyase family enzyme
MQYQFHHVHIICKDLEQMISFFTDAIGVELIARRKFGTADGASLDIQGTTVNLRVSREDEEMVGDASAMPPRPDTGMIISVWKLTMLMPRIGT